MLSLKFENIYINSYESIVGPNEKNGNLSNVKNVIEDYYYGEKSFELAQIKMQKNVIDYLLSNNKYTSNDIDLIIGGDLVNQISSTYYSCNYFDISSLGIYSACATFTEGLIIGSSMLSNENVKRVINITSSHNLVCERQFRYPVEYGAIRNVNSTFTATAAVGCILSKTKSNILVKDATIGYPIDYDIKDPNMIGSIMAPAAAEVIINHLNNFKRKIDYYDLILTGDLGEVGLNILKDYLKDEFNIEYKNILDAGNNLYNNLKDINDGASGPAALPLYFFFNILNKKKYKKILLVGTGSLHTKNLVNQKKSIPAIAHAVTIEVKR